MLPLKNDLQARIAKTSNIEEKNKEVFKNTLNKVRETNKDLEDIYKECCHQISIHEDMKKEVEKRLDNNNGLIINLTKLIEDKQE